MRNWKKYVAVTLAAVTAATCLTGCGGGSGSKKKGSSTEIEIGYWNSGLSTEWLDAVIKAFEDKYPQYTVTYNPSASSDAVIAAFGKETTDTTDLYLAGTIYDTTYMEPLDDVLDSKADGESKTLREKINTSYLQTETHSDGKVYTLTYGGGILGFVYNTKLFAKAGIETEPRTSDELVVACDKLDAAGITPMCHFSSASYWSYISDAWRVQYDGMDYFVNNFYGCTDENGKSPSKAVFTKEDGRLEVIKVCEKVITPDYVLQGSNTQGITVMQTKFLQGEAAMMVTGAWVANEMRSVGKMDDFTVMKTPVISSITDKLTTVKKEKDLRTVISAVDAVTDGKKDLAEYQDGENYLIDGLSVSAADWEYIRKARNTEPTNFAGESMFIPKYSNAKEGAKEFVKFLYSDEGYKVYADTLHITLPTALDSGELDTSDWNSFEQTMYKLSNSMEQNATSYLKSKHPIFWVGGAAEYGASGVFGKFCANNEKDRLNAETAWKQVLKEIDTYYETSWVANLGE